MLTKPIIWIAAVIGIAIIFLFIGKIAGHSCHKWGSSHHKGKHVLKFMSKKLDLNEDQKTKLAKIQEEIYAKKGSFVGLKKELMTEANRQFSSSSLDKQAVNQLLEKKENEFKTMRLFVVEKMAEFHAMLTPDQREKVTQMINKAEKRCNR